MTDHWQINRVQLKAFKSFGPAGCTFDVPSHLVGIVGPNGCGKSNLLEAICFAAAGSNSVLRLSGRSLQEVSCTDAGSQRPEVHVRIARGNTAHLLEASLAPDGTRSYRIDGKIKSGTQVKEFLKARGIVINGTTVIQQAAVTQLSDNNNAHALAELVAAASGLSSWNLQTAAARQEIARTHKALTDIQANISKVRLSVAAEDVAFQVAAEAAQLEQRLEQQVQDLLRRLGQREQQLQGLLQERQQDEQQTKESEEVCDAQLQHLSAQRKALATQQAEVLAQLDSAYQTYSSATDRAGSNDGGITNPTKQLASAEAQVVSLQAAVAARAELVLDLEKTQRLLQQQEGRCSLLQQRVDLKQQEAAGLASSLTAVKSSSDAAAALKQQAQEAGMQAAAVAAALEQQQELVLARQHDVQQAHERLRNLKQNVQARSNTTTTHATTPLQSSMPSTVAEASCAVAAAAAAATAAASAADGHTRQLAGLHQELLRLQMQVQASERPLTPAATVSLLAQVTRTSRALPLHACFSLKGAEAAGLTEQQLQLMLTPLSVIAGPAVLQTLVTASVSDANRVLAAAAAAGSAGFPSSSSSRRLKIWPLDNLSVFDQQQQQRMAQQQLGKHAVMLPLDMLEFESVYQPAMLRAFGGFVIAADDATAAALVERFGLSAVTLQGTVSRKGSMTGGWTGSSGSHAKTFWSNKHRHDLTAQQHAACGLQLAAVQAQQQQLQQEKAAAESHLAAVQQHLQLLQEIQQVRAEADAAEAAFQQDEQQLQELQTRSGNLKARLLQYQAATGRGTDGGGATLGAAGSSRGSSSRTQQPGSVGEQPLMASLQQQLQAEADKAAAAVAAAEQELDEAQEQVEELCACIEALECRLSSSKEPQQQQEELQQALHTVQQLQQQQAADKAAAAALEEHLHQLQQQQLQLDKQLEAAEQQQKGMQQQSLRAVAGVKAAVAALQKKKAELKQALNDYSGTDAVQAYSRGLLPAQAGTVELGTAAGSAAAAKAAPPQPSELQLQQLSKAAKQLHTKLLRLDVPELLPGQQEALAARLGQIAGFNEQADALKAAAAALEGQIAQDAGQVHAANDVVFEDIAAGFSQLCSSLLPSLELQLVRTGSQAHEGLQFRFRRLEDDDAAAAAAAGCSADAGPRWQTNLGQLSGGQRTLVSLAMLLAVARTGSACGLLLLDEIDAALDEVNQARASALLWQLAHDSTSACQIMCVTHNVSFQERCDGFVRVTKSAAGHSIPAGQSGEARPDDAGGSQGAGGSRKGAKPRRGTYGNARAGQPGAAEGISKRVGTSRAKKVRFVDMS